MNTPSAIFSQPQRRISFAGIVHLLAQLLVVAIAASVIGCASLSSHEDIASYGPVQTGSYIPRRVVRHDGSDRSSKERKVAKAKRQKRAERASKPAATRPADDDYVTRGGFR